MQVFFFFFFFFFHSKTVDLSAYFCQKIRMLWYSLEAPRRGASNKFNKIRFFFFFFFFCFVFCFLFFVIVFLLLLFFCFFFVFFLFVVVFLLLLVFFQCRNKNNIMWIPLVFGAMTLQFLSTLFIISLTSFSVGF